MSTDKGTGGERWCQLLASTIDAICGGCSHIVLWGFNEECARVVHALAERGWERLIEAVVDHRPFAIGCRVGAFTVQPTSGLAALLMDCLVITLDQEKTAALRELFVA